MRVFAFAIPALPLLLAACGSSGPTLVRDGARLDASPAAEWRTAAPPRQAAFSRDGRLLATSDASGRITLRRTDNWRTVASFVHPAGATSVAFGRDGATLYSGGYDGKVRGWNVASRSQTGVLNGAEGTIWTLDVSPDGSRIAGAGEDAAIHVWKLDQPGIPTTLRGHERNIWAVRFSPDGKQLASGSFDHTARLWDSATGKPLKTLQGHEQAVVSVAFSPDGKLLATSGDDSTIRLWRMPDGAALRTLDNGNHTYSVAFSPDGKWLVSGGRARGAIGTFWHQVTGSGGMATPVQVRRLSDMAVVNVLPHPDDVMGTAFSVDGRWLVTSGEDNRFRLWALRESAGHR